MTMDDVVMKTGITFLVTVLDRRGDLVAVPGTPVAVALLFPALIVGLALGLVILFKTITNPATILAYAAVEGVLVGAISEFFAVQYDTRSSRRP